MKRKNFIFWEIFGHFRSYFLSGYWKSFWNFTEHCSMFLRMNLDYPKHCLGHTFPEELSKGLRFSRKYKISPPARCDIMNFVAGNYLLNPRRHSYWWSRTIWINIRFIRFSVWAVKVSKIQIFKFYDKIVKAIIMGIFVANKTRQLDRSKIRVLTSKGWIQKTFAEILQFSSKSDFWPDLS